MKLFNTQTQKLTTFQPNEDGITICVYDAMTGEDVLWSQAVTCCTADILVRYLQSAGHSVSLHLVLKNSISTKETLPDALLTTLQTLNISPPDHVSLGGDVASADILVTSAQGLPHQKETPLTNFCLETAVPLSHSQQPPSLIQMSQSWSADALRVCLAQHHYRQPWHYDAVVLQKAAFITEKLKAALNARSTGQEPLNATPAVTRFTAVMDNDLDTSKGLATLLNLADEILFRAPNGYQIEAAQTALQNTAAVLGLCLNEETAVQEEMTTGWNLLRQQLEEMRA